ncbi:hypothetical protein CRX42_30885 [Pseudomonas jessenii]|uniref:Uncharacterized protein n=1 Tax=Pseudomonas jessenii TaxID=77298 RepID=A0A2W0EEJ2_PSEJE|nr:hypothetical protein CRX42_30885 [Pseudomonas jessenii]
MMMPSILRVICTAFRSKRISLSEIPARILSVISFQVRDINLLTLERCKVWMSIRVPDTIALPITVYPCPPFNF